MGVLADACLGVPLYSKLEEKKNGLDVYQSVDNDRSIYINIMIIIKNAMILSLLFVQFVKNW